MKGSGRDWGVMVAQKWTTVDTKPASVTTIAGDAEVDHAIATLVQAFSSDPVARWMYDAPHHYLRHIPQLFQALGASSFEASAARRTSDGLGVALWLPPGVHGDDGRVQAVIAESIAAEKQADVGAAFERTEQYRPTEPHWYLSLIGVEALHRNKGCGAALLQHGLRQCDREHRPAYLWSSNPLNISLYERHGFEIVGTIHVGSSLSIFAMLRHAR
jgi:ribosomal protein S18 acetylase RimI-like enzyme